MLEGSSLVLLPRFCKRVQEAEGEGKLSWIWLGCPRDDLGLLTLPCTERLIGAITEGPSSASLLVLIFFSLGADLGVFLLRYFGGIASGATRWGRLCMCTSDDKFIIGCGSLKNKNNV